MGAAPGAAEPFLGGLAPLARRPRPRLSMDPTELRHEPAVSLHHPIVATHAQHSLGNKKLNETEQLPTQAKTT